MLSADRGEDDRTAAGSDFEGVAPLPCWNFLGPVAGQLFALPSSCSFSHRGLCFVDCAPRYAHVTGDFRGGEALGELGPDG